MPPPLTQGIKWVMKREEPNGLRIIQQSQPKYTDTVRLACSGHCGGPCGVSVCAISRLGMACWEFRANTAFSVDAALCRSFTASRTACRC